MLWLVVLMFLLIAPVLTLLTKKDLTTTATAYITKMMTQMLQIAKQ
jgi:hypothetical protein